MEQRKMILNMIDKKGKVFWTSEVDQTFVRHLVESQGGSRLTEFEWLIFKDFIDVSGEVTI